jgi:xanthine dehydrogenase accessory factor
MLIEDTLVLIRGGGDLASGVVYRLHRAGFPVVITELAQPAMVRRAVAFAEAVYAGRVTIEGIVGRLAPGPGEARQALASGEVPVLVDPEGASLRAFAPPVVVDARLAKKNLGTRLSDAPLVVALGPGFTAGADCHAVVETKRGHTLGRVIWQGGAAADTGIPEGVAGHSGDRVLRAPAAGRLVAHRQIGDQVAAGDLIAEVAPNGGSDAGSARITAPFAGVLRGLVHPAVSVSAGMKVGDLDPRGQREYCFSISDKALAVGGGVLEAILVWRRASAG